MQRRSFLFTISGAATTLAGCLQSDSDEPGSNRSDAEQASNHIDDAEKELGDAVDELESESEKFDDAGDQHISFKTNTIHAHLDRAEESVDQAEPLANSDQQAVINTFRATIGWFRSFTDALGAFGDALDEMDTGITYMENERYTDSAEQFDVATDLLSDTDEQLTIAQNELEDIDTGLLEDTDEIDYLKIEQTMNEFSEVVEAMDYFAQGYRETVIGFDHFMTGATALDEERYGTAIEPFKEARNKFASAQTTFQNGEDIATGDLIDTFIEMTCLSESFRDAADYFSTASEAADDGDWSRAEEAYEKGGSAMERCE